MPLLTYDEVKLFSKINTNVFIETGTFMGDTINNIKSYFSDVYTIELNHDFARNATIRFLNDKNVKVIQGDSSDVLLTLCPVINKPAFFWLDGHWSGGTTAKGKKDCPLLDELNAIVQHFKYECVIAIDDVRLFGTNINEDWQEATRENVLEIVKSRLLSCEYFPSSLYEEDRMVLTLKGMTT